MQNPLGKNQAIWHKVSNLQQILGPLLTLTAFTIPTVAHAGGLEYPDNGTISIGRGGADAANPDDGLAFQYNPAGLAQQRGLRLTLDARLASQYVKFQSALAGTAAVTNGAPPFLSPSGSLSYGFGKVGFLSDLTIALGATGPSAIGKVRYPGEGAQRYALNSTDYFIGYYSLAVAAAWRDLIRIGLTGQLVHGTATFSQAVWSGQGQGPKDANDTQSDATATFSGTSGMIPTFVAGITVTPTPAWAIGISYRPQIDFNAPGTLDIALPGFAVKQGFSVEGNSADLHINLAATLRAGIQYKLTERALLELDGVWERWSSFKEIRVATHDILVHGLPGFPAANVPDVVFPHNFTDTYSIRLGSDVTVVDDRLIVRAGYLFETSAVPTAYVSMDFPNWQRHALSAGASLKLWGAWLDVAYAHHFVQSQAITDSQVVQQVAPETQPIPKAVPSVIGNGKYDSGLDLFSLSLRIPFSDLHAKF